MSFIGLCYDCFMSRLSQQGTQFSEFEAYFTILANRLENVPELQPGFELAVAEPELAGNIYGRYIELITSIARLSKREQAAIQTAKDRLIATHGNFGTAYEVSAVDLLDELGEDKTILLTLAASSTDTNSPYVAPALDELVHRMEGGHQLKVSGKQPNDDDAESRLVIWGHTMIANPTALLHFMICHYLERYFSEALSSQGSTLATQKDFLISALIDVVLTDHLGRKTFDDLYAMWLTPKQQGGLGWITDDRTASYDAPDDSDI